MGDKIRDYDGATYRCAAVRNVFADGAELEVFAPQQGADILEALPVSVEATLGAQTVREDDGFGFQLRFRRVFVQIQPEGARLGSDSYTRALSKERYREFLKGLREGMRTASGEVEAEFSLLTGLLDSLGLSGAARAEAKASIKRGDTSLIETDRQIMIVGRAPGQSWSIGDRHLGDPTKRDGLLEGPYIHISPSGQRVETVVLAHLEPDRVGA